MSAKLKYTDLKRVNSFELYYGYLKWYNTLVSHRDIVVEDEIKRVVDALAEIEDYALTLGADLTVEEEDGVIKKMVVKTKLGERRYKICQ